MGVATYFLRARGQVFSVSVLVLSPAPSLSPGLPLGGLLLPAKRRRKGKYEVSILKVELADEAQALGWPPHRAAPPAAPRTPQPPWPGTTRTKEGLNQGRLIHKP